MQSSLSQDDDGKLRLRVQLAAREGATGRPKNCWHEMGVRFQDTHVHREMLILIRD